MSITTEPIEFAPEELFFSTTDARGIIEKANGVFVRLSHHDWDELVGAPHNIIRHDDMPGGAFKLMWQTLQEGEAFCAYVVNEAADGRPYEVFATITPLGDGYLSVRSRPCVPALRETAFALYADARAVERQCLAQGLGRVEVATHGRDRLAALLGEAGLADYTEFMHQALPAEVQARSELVHGLPVREGEGRLHDLLRRLHEIDAQLVGWLSQMDSLAELAGSLRDAAAHLSSSMQGSRATAEEVVAAQTGFSPIMLAVNCWVETIPELDGLLQALLGRLAELHRSSAATRFGIALARLHLDATAAFVAELIDGTGAASGLDAVGDLMQALDQDIATAAREARRNAELAEAVASQIDEVQGLMAMPVGLLAGWQQMVAGRDDELTDRVMPRLSAEVASGEQDVELLAGLATSCREQANPLDTGAFEQALREARQIV